jgi:hypothetical protein
MFRISIDCLGELDGRARRIVDGDHQDAHDNTIAPCLIDAIREIR